MAQDQIVLHCPCCGEKLVIDVRRRTASKASVEGSAKRDMDEMLKATRSDPARLRAAFDDALEEESRRKQRLDDLFKQATDPDKRSRPEGE